MPPPTLTDIFKRLPTETNQSSHRLTPKAWAAEQAKIRQALAQTAGVPMSIERLSKIGLRGLGFTDTNIHHEHVI